MDILSTAALAGVASSTSITTAVAAPAPNALAATRFAELMAQPLSSAAPVTATGASGAVTSPSGVATGAPVSVGERILNGMQGVSDEFRATWTSAADSLNASIGKTATIQDTLKLQMQLVQAAFQYDVVGKLVSRSTQNIDQLVRMQ